MICPKCKKGTIIGTSLRRCDRCMHTMYSKAAKKKVVAKPKPLVEKSVAVIDNSHQQISLFGKDDFDVFGRYIAEED